MVATHISTYRSEVKILRNLERGESTGTGDPEGDLEDDDDRDGVDATDIAVVIERWG
jgi:hypothetical protein